MKKLFSFFRDAWTELKQVAWLTTPQMVASTWVVIILVIIVGVYIGVADWLLTGVMEFLYKSFGVLV